MANWGPATEPLEATSRQIERLIGIQSEVDPSGDSATCTVAFTNQHPFKVHMPVTEIGILIHELRQAAGQMVSLQRFKVDRGAEKIMEAADAALHPTNVDVLVNPLTADRIFILQFADNAPIAVCLTPDEVSETLAKMTTAQQRAAN